MAVKVINKSEKIKGLYEDRERYSTKLKDLYKHFRGVIHEDSASEMKYTTIKVYEDHVRAITEELRSLGEKIDINQ